MVGVARRRGRRLSYLTCPKTDKVPANFVEVVTQIMMEVVRAKVIGGCAKVIGGCAKVIGGGIIVSLCAVTAL